MNSTAISRPLDLRGLCYAACLAICAAGTAGAQTAPSPQASEMHFVRPAELERDVKFWQRVYTEVGTDGGFIHDESSLDVVYEKVIFASDVSPNARERRINETKNRYSAILRKLAGANPGELTVDERRVRDLWPTSASRATLSDAAQSIRFQLGQANRFKEGLVRSGQWRPQIQKIFTAQGLPAELAALPHVESSFNPYAYSKVGAAGMWQFMRSTGRRFLRIDGSVDERLDPYKSSQAAANFLEQNYSILGKWPLALTAYNHGPAGMRRAVDKLGTDDIAVIVRKYESRTFGFASRNFYLAFLAALEIDNNPEKFFGPIRRDAPDNSQIVVLPDYMPAASLASALGTDTEQLKKLNPSLLPAVWNGTRRVPRGYEFRAPPTIDLSQALARVPDRERHSAQVADTQHRVQNGETLSIIAARYGVSQTRLAELNDLRQPYRIRAGQILSLPQAAAVIADTRPATGSTPSAVPAASAVSVTTPPKPPTDDRHYIVRRGDSISRIARKHGLSEQSLMQLNNIKQSDFIYEGQVLALDSEAASTDPLPSPVTPAPAVVAAVSTPPPVTEAAEPTSRREAEELGPTLVPGAQTAASADPSDYTVDENDTVRVEAAETIGHYAEWLQVSASKLRALNKMSRQRPLVVGKRVKLDFSQVDKATFEARRGAYHQQMQDDFFAQFRIAGSDTHTVKPGDSIWIIAQKRYNVPLWLLRQYNPDVDLEALRPGTKIVIPKIEPTKVEATASGTP